MGWPSAFSVILPEKLLYLAYRSQVLPRKPWLYLAIAITKQVQFFRA